MGRPVRATITLYPMGRPVRATITLYPIGRPVRATITLYPIGRPVRATITLYPKGEYPQKLKYKVECKILIWRENYVMYTLEETIKNFIKSHELSPNRHGTVV